MSIITAVAIVLAIVVFIVVVSRAALKQARMNLEKKEAYFVSMFPDLQPYFHPAKLAEFVVARLARTPPQGGTTVPHPAGFAAADRAEVRFEPDKKGNERETWRLLDAAGSLLTQFVFENHPEGGVLRVGAGKFTVDTRVKDQPKVRYWHPDREFKWTPSSWRFTTRVAESAFDSNDRGTQWSDSSSSSTSTAAATAAGVAGIVAAGGAFDGGGASQAWSDGGSSSGATSGSESGAGSTSY